MKTTLQKRLALKAAVAFGALCVSGSAMGQSIFEQHFDSGVPTAVTSSPSFALTHAGSMLVITSAGHDEWDNIALDITNGGTSSAIAMTSQDVLYIRAKAETDDVYNPTLTATVMDSDGNDVNNETLAAVNKFNVTSDWTVFQVTFADWNSTWNTGNPVDFDDLTEIRLGINSGWASFPGVNNDGDSITDVFEGKMMIDYIAVGQMPSVGVGVNDVSELENALDVYPNPTEGQVSISVGEMFETSAQMSITDALGNQVYAGAVQERFSFEEFAAGLYIVSVTDRNQVARKPVMIK